MRARGGAERVKDAFPAQERTRAHLRALQAVNADGHKWDVFVRWEDGKVERPMMVAIQDLYSGKFLGWRFDRSENTEVTRLAFGDVFANYGIPDAVYLDNGRAFASKKISGGARNRFRFKIREEEPLGILKAFGCDVRFTLPYSGQSKPIERAFRDMCDHIARQPAFEGAYTGNRPDAKPENYGLKAVPIETFRKLVSEGIKDHNARTGRRSEVCAGRSLDAAFFASYQEQPIRRASEEQLRMCLLAAESVSTDKRNGSIRLLGNRYWSEAMAAYAGEKLIARFDPDDLTRDVHVYARSGDYLCAAPQIERAGFDDMAAARDHARARKAYRKAVDAKTAAERHLTPDQVAAMLPDFDAPEEAPARVVRMVRPQTGSSAAIAMEPEDHRDIEDQLERGLARVSGGWRPRVVE